MKFPFYRQLEARDCGPTCLRIIAKHYGKEYSLPEIKKACSVTRSGVSLQDIIDGAENIGFQALPLKLSIDKINEIPLPAILYWRQEHYIVLYQVDQKKVPVFHLADPSFGRIKVNYDLFTKQWIGNETDGIILLFEPTEDFYDKVPLPINRWGLYNKIKEVFKSIYRYNKTKVVGAFALLTIAMITTWFLPSIFRRIIDEGVLGKSLSIVTTLLIAQLIVFMSQMLSESFSSLMLMQINFKTGLQFLKDYLFKLIRLPTKIFDTKLNSDLLSRMDDSDRIQSFLTHHSLEFILSIVNLIVFSFSLAHYNAYALILFYSFSAFSISWMMVFLRKRKHIDYSRFTVASETRNNIYELINHMPEIKINNAHSVKIAQWETRQNKLNLINLSGLKLNYYQLIGANFFTRIKDILILGLCAYLVIGNRMTMGVMITISFIIGQLNAPVNTLISILLGAQDAKLSFERLDEIQQLQDENSSQMKSLMISPRREIEFKGVSFKYDGNFNPFVLEDINIRIPIGQVTAIVGTSGSGKTTMMKLLLGMYNPTKGAITIDNQNLALTNTDTWRSKCGVVLQDGYIFSGTYAENIAFSELKPDLERVRVASRVACIESFIDSLPLGFQTQIGRTGIDLSGGQKQRLLIARAVYKNPEFLFFDEATSSLDASNERQIIDNLQSFFKGRTVVIIAHRLSTVKNADQIVVVEHGQVVELNNHIGLVKQRGKYYNLVKNQLELDN